MATQHTPGPMAPQPRIVITKSRSGHYTATAILGRFRRSEGKLSNLTAARAAGRELAARVWACAIAKATGEARS